jgi:excisionase family DNA binding protein
MNNGEEESAMQRLTHQTDETAGGIDRFESTAGVATPAEKPPRLLLTVEEAAERIGICRSNMFKLIRRGDVKSVRVGRLRRVTPAALEDYVKRLSAPEDPAA